MELTIVDDSSRALDNIRVFAKDIEDFEGKVKTLSEMAKERRESLPEHDDLNVAQEQFKAAQDALKRALQQDSAYNNMLQDLADEKEALRSAKEHLSDHILAYWQLTGERQAPMAGNEARELLLSGKLGKPTQYQPSLFSKAKEDHAPAVLVGE
jgi:predicted nuclease with TOPRIM domain